MSGVSGACSAAETVRQQIARSGLIVVLRSPTAADAVRVGSVLLDAGVEVLELTGTTPDACQVLTALRARAGDGVLLGLGTIRSADEAHRADQAGADFLVSPGCPADLTEALLSTGRLVLPGVLTPTELLRVREFGIRTVKLFPACVVGPAGLTAMRGPFPDVWFVPTGGIAPHEVGHWLDAGALAVGVGGGLAPQSIAGDDAARALTSRVRSVLKEISRRTGS